ncbi:MAG: cell surface protein SprA [Bacteroidaceae bacterium]|nr:cell surface protein SprA [Bacteroidaceae bacterium]
MKFSFRKILYIVFLLISISAVTATRPFVGQGGLVVAAVDAVTEVMTGAEGSAEGMVETEGVAVDDDSVKVKKTDYPHGEHPEEFAMDLDDPDNLKPDTAEYDAKIGLYRVGTKLGDNFLSAPVLMTPQQYLKWTERKQMDMYFKQRNDSLIKTRGKSKFDFTDMKFDLGPAEKIFGPGGVQVKTSGSAELKMGVKYQFTDNPSLAEHNRKQTNFDFDEKIVLDVNAKVGDKMEFRLGYNTETTFDIDTKNIKLAFEGKEDDIVKKLEAGYVSFPTNSSLVKGASSLFGFRTDLQFGKLNLQAVISQKKSQTKTASSQGGSQLSTFEIQAYDYDENRHYFLAHYFREAYDRACATLPNITSGVTINRVEVWVTNTTGITENTRNIVGFVDMAEKNHISNSTWRGMGGNLPENASNNLYETIVNSYPDARNVDQVSASFDGMLVGGVDYEKIENARLMSSSEYKLNAHLGYISFNSQLTFNQVVAVAYEYTYGGKTYQVGEFASDLKDGDKTLYVKLLKNTSGSPKMGNWDLMMKNVYSLKATSLQKEKFRFDIKYTSDTTGVALSYLPEEQFKQTKLLSMMNLDRLDDNQKTNPNGRFDYIEGYTVNSSLGVVIFPVVEPFGDWLRSKVGNQLADKYCYDALYDSTKTVAKQIAEKNKFTLTGEYKGTSGSEISVGAINVAPGSVTVTAGGVTLTENVDYTVDYSSGIVTVINQSILDAGTSVSVSLEDASESSQMRKTMMGLNWSYDFSKNFQIGGTLMRVSERPLTTKVAMGAEPLNNAIWGLNVNWKQNSQWLTNMLDKIPLINVSAPSNISFTGEFAQLIAGEPQDVQANASYIDDFEDSRKPININNPSEWVMSSTPANLEYGNLTNDVKYGYNRALMSWYNIDGLFTRRSSSLTPSHIKSDLDQLSNHYVREVYTREVYPNRDVNTGESNTLHVMNVAYYPSERGPYNLDTDVDTKGRLNDPRKRWGGMMRRISQSDFETSNVQYIEFWMLDPFIYNDGTKRLGGDLYFNLGDISEDVLKDGKKAYESGMPVSGATTYAETTWGRVPSEKSVVYSFSNESGARQKQDIGIDGLADKDEREFGIYRNYLDIMKSKVDEQTYDAIWNDPAGDNYHYFRGTDYDRNEVSILDRYKHINKTDGNSPNTSESGESYSTAYTAQPDCEDVNGDYTMNEYENFFQYRVSLRPEDLTMSNRFIVDMRDTEVNLRNGKKEKAKWYLFRIPIEAYESRVGQINDFSSIRFMRMYLTDFEEPVVLRFASLDLVENGQWRKYQQPLYTGNKPSISGNMKVASVNIEENNKKTPVNYVLPPGVSRVLDPHQHQLTQVNEQALAVEVDNLAPGDARAVYKTLHLDLRNYKHLQMFVHANAMEGDKMLKDNDMSVFVRLGSDYKSNYYEYEIPLVLTPEGYYDTYSISGCTSVWPVENMLDIDLNVFTNLKHERNVAKAAGGASYNELFYQYDPDKPGNKVSVMGNPSLGEVKTLMIGVRNNGRRTNGVEVWVNEFRMQDYSNEGGWAAQGNMNLQLSDLGSVNLTGHVETAGFGGVEERVAERRDDNLYQWSATLQLQLGKLFPEKWKMQLPLYYSYSWQKISPKYNPFDSDMLLKDAMNECATAALRDSLSSLTESVTKNKNFSLSNWKSGYQSRVPMPYDPANFSLSYSYSERNKYGETTMYENEMNWKANLTYNYTPKYKTWEPFKKLKGKSKWLDILKAQNLNYLPQTFAFNTDISRNYYEFQQRDVDAGTKLPVTFSEQFLWNRDLNVRWDIFRSLKLSWKSSTHAEIEEPYTVINKSLYPDEYSAWKDSVKRSLGGFGRPLKYASTFTGSYTLPLNKIPILDWMTADGSYNSTYGWNRGTELEDGRSLGHTATTQRTINLNGRIDFEKLYKKWKALADVESRFSGSKKSTTSKTTKPKPTTQDKSAPKTAADAAKNALKKATASANEKKDKGYSKQVMLNDTAAVELKHGQNSNRIIVRATTKDGKAYALDYKKKDKNTIIIRNLDSASVKVNVVAKKPLSEEKWYDMLQYAVRPLLSIRNASIIYRNSYALTLPGFRTEVGDAFGQRSINGMLSPGLDFAFGAVGEDYIDKAARNGWLMQDDSTITTPATTNGSEDLQIKMSLEPVRDVKIDLNASRTVNRSRSIRFMYAGMPETRSGSFTMSIISISSAFSSGGNIANNYHSKPFDKFLKNLDIVKNRIEGKYAGTNYPSEFGPTWAGKPYDAANGEVDKYSADVMIPAFLSAYCGRDAHTTSLDLFPKLLSLLPNWSIKYAGLSKLAWFSDHFKSFNINHAYTSTYAVGAYNTYTNYVEFMDDMGFVTDVKSGNPIPSSMYNMSTVSIKETFMPLIGVDMTFNSGMTAKLEYKKVRTLNLSMTSLALTEDFSNDIVIGFGYKIKDLNLFGAKRIQSDNSSKKKGSKDSKTNSSSSKTTTNKTGISHDLNIRADFSYQMKNALNRNIQTAITTATNGATAYKIAARGDYTFSRLLTLSAYLEWHKNVPLVSTSSYPTTSADFGLSVQFKLTR